MLITTEPDCEDQAVTPMPTHCLRWACAGDPAAIVRRRGAFLCCMACGGSYGAATRRTR